ncbi:glutathione S-transferase C-terminal domain-containing protein [Burkholderia vietnamiensis]|uniref:glutathione S-transferase C-terminal domain-containing protein n=1 Tax=Burkholderia vietnamiensis TaxID=60552 RepID=UPI001CB4C24A|nr:glutathione S-transferase C-terminal domain-containing protein [Burkholderia vietnamiensis]CAG9227004.1 Glutathione S-transferase GstA [Burkholderia vietnamiensis]
MPDTLVSIPFSKGSDNIMKLFYHPGACSLAVHIALIEAGMSFKLVSINRDKRTADGRDLLNLNPYGFIPTLELDDGNVLGEALANLVYIAENTGRLLPKSGLDRWRSIEAVSFMATELHGGFKPLWTRAPEAEQTAAKQLLTKRFVELAARLGDKPFVTGGQISIADPYLFVMLRWARTYDIDVPEQFDAYFERMQERPSIQQALTEEGLA